LEELSPEGELKPFISEVIPWDPEPSDHGAAPEFNPTKREKNNPISLFIFDNFL